MLLKSFSFFCVFCVDFLFFSSLFCSNFSTFCLPFGGFGFALNFFFLNLNYVSLANNFFSPPLLCVILLGLFFDWPRGRIVRSSQFLKRFFFSCPSKLTNFVRYVSQRLIAPFSNQIVVSVLIPGLAGIIACLCNSNVGLPVLIIESGSVALHMADIIVVVIVIGVREIWRGFFFFFLFLLIPKSSFIRGRGKYEGNETANSSNKFIQDS